MNKLRKCCCEKFKTLLNFPVLAAEKVEALKTNCFIEQVSKNWNWFWFNYHLITKVKAYHKNY